MTHEWPMVPLGQLVDPLRGISYGIVQPGDHVLDGIPIVRAGDLRGDRIDVVTPLRVSPQIEAKYVRTRLSGGELLISIVGTVGQTAIVSDEYIGWNTARAVAVIPAQKEVGAHWIKIALRTSAARSRIDSRLNTTVQSTLNLRDIADLPIALPPPAARKSILTVLGALDDKIELNRRMNETLERTARSIFKDWFVDFGPTRTKMAMRGEDPQTETVARAPYLAPEIWSLFPDRLDDEGKPEGWIQTKLGELCSRIAIGPFGSDITTDNFVASGVPVIRGGNLKAGFIDAGFVFLTEEKATSLKNAVAYPGDIIITHRGTLGQVGIIPEAPRFSRYVISQSQMLLSADLKIASPRYLFEFLRSEDGIDQLLSYTSQTGVPAIARPTTSLKSIDTLKPPHQLLRTFDEILAPLVQRESANLLEIETLSATRDLLLPKLMTGEIRVKDAEKLVGEVA